MPRARGVPIGQPLLQELGEQMMVPIPAPFVVQREDEEVQCLQLIQALARVAPSRDEVAQLHAKARQDRSGEEKILGSRIEIGQHRIAQKIRHIAVCAGEPESVTLKVSGVALTGVEGVPLMSPLDAFRVSEALVVP